MVTHPQKILADRYQVVPRSIILLIKDDRVLLQKAPESKKIFPGLYNGIGGHIERGEDVLTGTRRELHEEAGVSCSDLHLAGTIMIDVRPLEGILLFVFTGSNLDGEPVQSSEGTLHWIRVDQLIQYKVVEDIPELVAKIQEQEETGELFFGKYLYDENGQRSTSWVTH